MRLYKGKMMILLLSASINKKPYSLHANTKQNVFSMSGTICGRAIQFECPDCQFCMHQHCFGESYEEMPCVIIMPHSKAELNLTSVLLTMAYQNSCDNKECFKETGIFSVLISMLFKLCAAIVG